MAASEDIGGIAISVTGDYSDLESAFQEALAQAQSDGDKLAQAIQDSVGKPDVSGVTAAFGEVTDAATATGQAITQALDVQVTPPDVSAVVDSFAALGESAKDAASAITDGFSGVGAAIQSGAAPVDDFYAALGKLTDAGASIDEAFQQLTGDTQTFMEAISSGSLNTFVDNFGRVGTEAEAAATGLAAVSTAAGEVRGAYETGATSAEALATAEKDVATAAQSAAPAIKETGDAASQASIGFGDLATQLLALGGISLTVEALVELGKAAVEASDKLDDAAYAIGRLNQGAMTGKEEIAGLLAVAQDEGLSFPGLVTAAQHMETLGIHGQDVIDTLQKLGNASELTGGSIDSMAQKFATLAEGTNISAMSLKRIGLTVDEVKETMIDMGANADQVNAHWQQLWKTMDETQHADVLKGALENLDGAAKAMNDDIKGDVQRTMNEFYVAIGKLGDVIAPLAQQALPYLVDALKVLVVAADASITSFKVLLDVLVGYAGALKDVYAGLAAAGSAIAKADFSGAATAVTDSINRIKTDMSDMSTKIQAGVKAGADFAKQAWGVDVPAALVKTSAAAKDTSNELGDLSLKSKDAAGNIQAAFAQIASFEDKLSGGGSVSQLQAAFENVSKAINTVAKVDLPAAIQAVDDYTAAQIRNGAGASVIMGAFQEFSKLVGQLAKIDLPAASAAMTDYIGKLSLAKEPIGIIQAALEQEEKMLQQLAKQDLQAAADGWDKLIQKLRDTNAPVQILNQALQDHAKFLDGVTAAATKAAEAMAKAAVAYSDFNTKGPAVSQTLKDAAASMEALGIMAAKAPQPISDLNRAMIDAGASAAKAKNAFEDLHTPITTIVTDMDRLAQAAKSSGDWSAFLTGLDSVDKRIQELAKTDLPEAAKQFETFIQGMINSGAPIDLVQGQLSKLEPILAKMAKEDLPGAADAWKKYLDLLKQVPSAIQDIQQSQEQQLQKDQQILDSMKARGDAYGYILDQQQKVLQEEIAIAEKTGQDANDQVLGIEKIALAKQAAAIQSHGYADEEVKMIKDIISGFDQMGAAMSDAIVNGKNLGDALIGQFKKIGQSILTDIINAALLPLKLALLELIGGLLPGMSGALGIVGGGLGAVNTAAANASAGLTALAESAQAAAASINSSVATGGADDSGAGGSGGGGLASTVGAISSVVSAGAAVASAILLAHISSDTGHIEVNTRSCLAELENARADAWSQHNQLYDRLGELLTSSNHIFDKLSTLTITSTGVISDADSKAIQEVGHDTPAMLADLQDIDIRVAGILDWQSTLSSNIVEGFVTNHEDLFLVVGTIQALISAINYKFQSSSGQIMEASADVQQSIESGTQQAHAALSKIDSSIQAGTASGRQNTQLTNDELAQKFQQQLAAAQAQYDASTSVAQQIAALKDQMQADQALANAALKDGNVALAAQYQRAAQQVADQITPLLSATNNVHAAVVTVDTSIRNGSTDVAMSATNAGVLVSTAVGQSAVTISNAVINSAAASASLFNSGISSLTSIIGAFGKAGGGLPGGQSGLPSGSGLGNTNPNGTASYTLPGVNNPGVVNGQQAGFNPNAPATGGMTQAQWEATGHASQAPDWWLKGTPQPGINQSNIPHFLTGGTVEVGGLAVVDKGEIVIPEDQAIAVKSGEAVVSSPSLTGPSNVLFTQPNKNDLSSQDQGFVDHGPSVDADAWKGLADQVKGVGDAIAAQDKARAAVADQMTTYQKEMVEAQTMLASATAAGNKDQITLAKQWIALMQGLIDSTLTTAKKPGVEVTTVGNKPGVEITAVSDPAAKAIGSAMNKTPVMDPETVAVMAKPGIEITAVSQQVAGSVKTISTALTSIANGPMNKTPIQDPNGQSVQIVSVAPGALAAFAAAIGGASGQQQSGPSQEDLLAASMDWLNAQQGLTADQKAISAATYQADAKAGLLPSPGSSGSSFSGYNPYSTPNGPAPSAPASAAQPKTVTAPSSGPANKTPLIDPTFAQPSGPMNKTPIQDVPSFDDGGFVWADMIANIHKGEWVVPEDVTGMLRRMATVPQMGGISQAQGNFTQSSSDSYTFIIPAGNRDAGQLLREISSAVKTRTGRTAKFSN